MEPLRTFVFNSMSYNGLKDDMNILAKFVFIYEKKIKGKYKVDDFAKVSTKASYVFKHDIQPLVKFAKKKEIANQSDFSKHTLFFTSDGRAAQIYNFCRHLRNSFVHTLLEKENGNLIIVDKNQTDKKTSTGFIAYSIVNKFLIAIVNEYEEIDSD